MCCFADILVSALQRPVRTLLERPASPVGRKHVATRKLGYLLPRKASSVSAKPASGLKSSLAPFTVEVSLHFMGGAIILLVYPDKAAWLSTMRASLVKSVIPLLSSYLPVTRLENVA